MISMRSPIQAPRLQRDCQAYEHSIRLLSAPLVVPPMSLICKVLCIQHIHLYFASLFDHICISNVSCRNQSCFLLSLLGEVSWDGEMLNFLISLCIRRRIVHIRQLFVVLQSYFKLLFQERRLQATEREQIDHWMSQRPGERILDIGKCVDRQT